VIAESGVVEKVYMVLFSVGYLPSSNARLSDLSVDGATIDGFAPATTTYMKELPQGTSTIPVVAGTAEHDSATVNVTQASNLTGTAAERTATVEVTAEDGTKVSYTVEFSLATGIEMLELAGIKIYTVGKILYIETESFNTGDRANIYDITGQLVRIHYLENNLEEIPMDYQGLYLVKLLNNDAVYSVRVRIMK
jgi:hypothetical protein